jgi:hypothetical protein
MKNKALLSILLILIFFSTSFSQAKNRSYYYKELKSFQGAVQRSFYDKASGYYFVVTDSSQRETKNGYLRAYTYLWSLCAMYQAANEIEKLEPSANLMKPLVENMANYYNPAPPAGGYTDYIMKLKPGERYYDDNQWIGITALDAYARTKNNADLKLGKAMYDFMMTGYNQVLGGGIYWKEGSLESKNTCSNGPGVLVALQMYKATKQKAYLDTALKIFNWTNEKLRTPQGLYYDNIRTKDGSIDKATLSYNTGTMLESNIYLYELTGNKKYLTSANSIADSSLAFFYGNGKFRDGYWFNAVLLRGYQHLLKHNKDTKYVKGFQSALNNALETGKNDIGLFVDRKGIQNLVEQGGMLEILARFAWLEREKII